MNRLSKILLGIGMGVTPLSVCHAQKDTQFSQFMNNQLFFNPATSGLGDVATVQLTHRNQYSGYKAAIDGDGAISSQLLTASMPLKNWGIGLIFLNDNTGAYSAQDLELSAAYKIAMGGGNLSIGGRAGFYRQALDFGRLRPVNPDDPVLGTDVVSQMQPDASIGIHFQNSKLHVGASAVHLLGAEYRFTSTSVNKLEPAFYVNAGYNLPIGYQIQLQPVILAKTSMNSLSSFSAEGGAIVNVANRYWVGATYRHQDAFAIVMAGISMLSDQSLKLSGAYDFVIGGNFPKNTPSFEVTLSKSFGISSGGQKSIIRTPRFRF